MPDLELRADADDQQFLALVVSIYHATLKDSPEALDYLHQRGVTDEAIDHFRLGFADGSLRRKLPTEYTKPINAGRRRLRKFGIYRADTGYEHFRGCVVFPVIAADGRILDIYGRKLKVGNYEKELVDAYLHSERHGVWNLQGLTAGEIVLCSTIFEALAFWCQGRRNVTCTFNPDALTEDHVEAFHQLNVQRVLLTNEALAPRLHDIGIECDVAGKKAEPEPEPAQPIQALSPAPPPPPATPLPTVSPASTSTPIDIDLDPDWNDQKILGIVLDYYQRTLKNNAVALDYLRKRGFINGEALDKFRIGYANRTLGLKVPKKLKRGRALRRRLERLGIFRPKSGHEHYNGCIVFPILAADGSRQIVNVYGRRIMGKLLRYSEPMHVHLNDQRRGVWNLEAFAASQEIILCFSLFDALTFWTHNYRNVTCMFGRDALTFDHLAAFRKFNIKRVLTPCPHTAAKLVDAGFECGLMRFPKSLDANAYALEWNNPAEALGNVLRKAEWLTPTTSVAVPVEMPSAPAITTAAVEPTPADHMYNVEPPTALPAAVAQTNQPVPMLPAPPSVPPPSQSADPMPDEVTITSGNRRYRVRGMARNVSRDILKVTILVSNEAGTFVDSIDLYSSKHRRGFIAHAAQELSVAEQTIKKDLSKLLFQLEEFQAQQLIKAQKPTEQTPTMPDEQREAALQLLRDPKLLDRIVNDFEIVGESTNKLVGYLAAVSRKLDQPLAIIIQSTSAAGKTALMDAVLAFLPPEDVVKFSAMTGQSLFYMGDVGLKHKILAIVEEEGAERASYALKLLQSEGELRIASTGKEASTGRLTTQEYRVEGPVMIFLTTTAIKIDEELLNRCLVLTVDEDREQTKAIHQAQRQRQTLQGLLSSQDRQHTFNLHRNAQRLLRPLLVANPFAESLTFLDDKTRTRRDHVKYLTLIRAIALLHQHQRPIKTVAHNSQTVEYIEVTLDDIETANKLASEVLGRSLDEMPPQTRRLLNLIDQMVTMAYQQQGIDRADYRFSRRQVREFTGWGQTQLQLHLRRLVEMEHLIIHRGQRGRSFVYELVYEAPVNHDGGSLPQLVNVERLRRNLSGVNGQLSG